MGFLTIEFSLLEGILTYLGMIGISVFLFRKTSYAFLALSLAYGIIGLTVYWSFDQREFLHLLLGFILPGQLFNVLIYGAPLVNEQNTSKSPSYKVRLAHQSGTLTLQNIRRGVSVIGSAGSGKTESIVYNLIKHFHKNHFCGVIHDYKNYEITELAYPLYKEIEDVKTVQNEETKPESDNTLKKSAFHIISFDKIYKRVNPIAPHYLPDEESVNEVSRVLLENLLEQQETSLRGSSKFFNDAVEGLLGGLMWKLKTEHPNFCTLPHLIATYQHLDTLKLIDWLSSDVTSRAMADAFISGRDSERQTAGVLSTLANALKKISTQRIFMALSADDIPLDINNPKHPAIVSIVNNPKFETAYSPIVATIMHTIIKQMSLRDKRPSFVLMEEAPTIRLLNMHRIPATLRSYDIATIYVLQDKAQNDLMYGEKASRAILSNLSYQFFGKSNDPETSRYYEQFFELVKKPTKSVSKAADFFKSETRVTRGEREVSKVRSDAFFRLRQGEFIAFADGKDRRIHFPKPRLIRALPNPKYIHEKGDFEANFNNIHAQIRILFK